MQIIKPLAYLALLVTIPILFWFVAQMVKNSPAMQETQVWSLGQEDPLEKRMATHSSILAWREFHGQRSLVGYRSPRGAWGRKESDMTEWLTHIPCRLARASPSALNVLPAVSTWISTIWSSFLNWNALSPWRLPSSQVKCGYPDDQRAHERWSTLPIIREMETKLQWGTISHLLE